MGLIDEIFKEDNNIEEEDNLLDLLGLDDNEKELVKKKEYDSFNFEEEELEDDDYYFEDDI